VVEALQSCWRYLLGTIGLGAALVVTLAGVGSDGGSDRDQCHRQWKRPSPDQNGCVDSL